MMLMCARHHKHPQFWILWGGICNFISGKTKIMDLQEDKLGPMHLYSDISMVRWVIKKFWEGGEVVILFHFLNLYWISFISDAGFLRVCCHKENHFRNTFYTYLQPFLCNLHTISIKVLSNSFNIKFCTMSITKQWVEDAIEECTEMIIS